MPRHAEIPRCTDEILETLRDWATGRAERRMVERAKIILGSIEGQSDAAIANELGLRPNTVGMWRHRFIGHGLEGLFDLPRPGQPRKRDAAGTRKSLLGLLDTPPPKGQAKWDGKALAEALGITADKVWRILREEGISLQRHRNWRVGADADIATKVADIVGLYLNPPQDAIVISVEEKPSGQAIEPPVGYVFTSSVRLARELKRAHARNGSLNLFAALEVATAQINAKVTGGKKRLGFLDFMDRVSGEYPSDKEIHAILENYPVHGKTNAWLAAHPNFTFHFTPTSASWLNLVGIWFSIMATKPTKPTKGASLSGMPPLAKAINDFISVYNERAEPFVWRKR
ncbi:MAG: IS630 family transposase [Deltaproteobacteria bacterium]|jgi:transposase|nr:IS630 family transposase [Deltaproteobacteria bacterium]